MNWRIKGVVQKTLSVLPGGVAVNDLLQRTVGGLRHFEHNVATKVHADWIVMAGHMRALGQPLAGRRYLEIGTGWYPTLPVCFLLAGAAGVISFDLRRHWSARLTERMWRALAPHLPAIAAAAGRDLDEVRTLYARRPVPEYRAPADAAASGLPDQSVDVVFSNSVLEHVPRAAIQRLMREAYRVLRPGGLSIHSVNCADHYAYFDRSITFMNYYRFGDAQWRFWNNDLQYQNRLRPVDFIALSEEAGFRTVLAFHQPRPELLAQLPALPLAAEFRHYPPEQLACTSVDFVGQKP
jgi:SAM-dependent methyltransferase